MENETQSTASQLFNLGPWIVSLLALVQVWVIEAWKKWRNGKVKIHDNGRIEIGYSRFGPTVGLFGTLQATKQDLFVKSATLELTRMKDNAKHEFSWLAFRSTQISLTGDQVEEPEIASGFLLPVNDPYKYNFLFNEDVFLEEFRNRLDEHQDEWLEYYRNRTDEMLEEAMDQGRELADGPALREHIFDEFSNKGGNTDVYDELNRFCYWEGGDYELKLKIYTTDHDAPFVEKYKFTLEEEDAEQLRTNVIGILRSIAGVETNFYFAYSDLQEVSDG